jgi:hypothetical protein
MCWNMARPVSLGGAWCRGTKRVSVARAITARCDQNLSMCDKLYSNHYEHDYEDSLYRPTEC